MTKYSLLFLAGVLSVTAAPRQYTLSPDSQRQPGVPQGAVTKFTWTSPAGGVFPGMQRDYWVYVPAEYTPDKPACLMVFQDGAGQIREDGDWRVPIVLDNLIHQKAIPITIGVFVNPAPAELRHSQPRCCAPMRSGAF